MSSHTNGKLEKPSFEVAPTSLLIYSF